MGGARPGVHQAKRGRRSEQAAREDGVEQDPGRRRTIALAVTGLIVVAAIAVVVVRQSRIVLDAPAPTVSPPGMDSLPPMPVSVIEAPVRYALGTAIDSLEAAVPRDYGDLDARISSAKNKRVSFSFRLHRSPFRVKVREQTVTISADVEYSGRVWYAPPIGPEIEVSCGTEGEPPRRATLTLETQGALTEAWGLRTKSRIVELRPYSDDARDRCRLTFLRIDVTDRVMTQTRGMLEDKLAGFDRAVARWPVRRRFEKIWRDLQKPVRLADSVYLAFHPSEAFVGSIGAHGDTAFADLRLVAAPRVTTGPRPQLERTPLPPLGRAREIGRGASVLIDASFTYPVATVMLRKAVAGRTIEQGGHRIRIRDVRMTGIGGGRVALGVWLQGAVRGRLFFTGTPTFDWPSHQITVPDLEYDVGTAKILVLGYEWLNEVSLRDFLREKARLPDSAVVYRLRMLAEQGINRRLPARGTQLSGKIREAAVVGVRATLEDIRVRALAEADLALSIDRAPSIPRPPKAKGEKPEEESDADEEP